MFMRQKLKIQNTYKTVKIVFNLISHQIQNWRKKKKKKKKKKKTLINSLITVYLNRIGIDS
jgi:hypothetical protein